MLISFGFVRNEASIRNENNLQKRKNIKFKALAFFLNKTIWFYVSKIWKRI
jgi:hypothetical protein